MLVNFLMLLRVLYHILTKDIQDIYYWRRTNV